MTLICGIKCHNSYFCLKVDNDKQYFVIFQVLGFASDPALSCVCFYFQVVGLHRVSSGAELSEHPVSGWFTLRCRRLRHDAFGGQ